MLKSQQWWKLFRIILWPASPSLSISVYAVTIILQAFFLSPRVLERSFFLTLTISFFSSDLAANEFLKYQVTYTYL